MARQPRIQYDGAFYHVMSRGDRREAIFEDDRDREMFLETLTRENLNEISSSVHGPNLSRIVDRPLFDFKQRQEWLAVAEGLELFGWSDRAADRRDFVERLEQQAREDEGHVASPHEGLQNRLERGWYWGSQSFREKMLKLVKGKGRNRNYRSSALMQDEQKSQASDWLERGRKHFKLTGPLAEAPRLARVSIAWALHRRTNQSQGWIASELGLRTAANVSQQVRRFGTFVDEGKFRRDKLVSAWVKSVKNC